VGTEWGQLKLSISVDHGFIGAARATLIYRALVEHQAAEIPVDWRVAVYFAPSNAGEDMKAWLGPPAVLRPTLAAARRQTLSICLLRPLVDIDDATSLNDQSKIFPFLRESCQPS
jgi:hypothetical protein